MALVPMTTAEATAEAYALVNGPYYLQLTTDDLAGLDDTFVLASQFNSAAYIGYAPKVLSCADVKAFQKKPIPRYRFTAEGTDMDDQEIPEPVTYTITGWYLHDAIGNVLMAESLALGDIINLGDYVEFQPNVYANLVTVGAELPLFEDASLLFPDWVTSTEYAPGKLLTHSADRYAVLLAHTSGTFATDLAADKLVLIS